MSDWWQRFQRGWKSWSRVSSVWTLLHWKTLKYERREKAHVMAFSPVSLRRWVQQVKEREPSECRLALAMQPTECGEMVEACWLVYGQRGLEKYATSMNQRLWASEVPPSVS